MGNTDGGEAEGDSRGGGEGDAARDEGDWQTVMLGHVGIREKRKE